MASEIGSMSAADAIFDRTFMTVSPNGHRASGASLNKASIAMIAPVESAQCTYMLSKSSLFLPTQQALIVTLRISNNQRLKMFCEAL